MLNLVHLFLEDMSYLYMQYQQILQLQLLLYSFLNLNFVLILEVDLVHNLMHDNLLHHLLHLNLLSYYHHQQLLNNLLILLS
jgi:hypothetical protein